MMKKIWMILSILLVLGLFFVATTQVAAGPVDTSNAAKTRTPHGQSGTPHGQSGTPHGQQNDHGKKVNLRGTVESASATSLGLTLQDGSSVTIVVDEKTRIKIPTLGRNATMEDLNIGVTVHVQATKAEDGTLTALKILVVPGKPEIHHRVGTVTAYTEGDTITIEDKNGDEFTYELTEDTRILPEERAGDLAIGSIVTIISPRDVTGGPLTAAGIVVHPQAETTVPTP